MKQEQTLHLRKREAITRKNISSGGSLGAGGVLLGSAIQGLRNHSSDELIVLAKQALEFRQDFRHFGIIRVCGLCTQLTNAFIEWEGLHTCEVAPIQMDP